MSPFPDNLIDRAHSGIMNNTSNILGIDIDQIDQQKLFSEILFLIKQQGKFIVGSANIHTLNLGYRYTWFRNFYKNAAIVTCDGFGVKLSSEFLGQKKLQRITHADWFPGFCSECALNGISIYFLGGNKGVAALAANKLKMQIPGLQIVGTHNGFFIKEKDHPENYQVLGEIGHLKPDILVVGFGAPLQENWIIDNWDELECKVIMPVGAMLDYLSGNVRRAPHWMTDHGLEWLGRMIIEPRRLWKRYLIGNPIFYFHILKQKIGLLHLFD